MGSHSPLLSLPLSTLVVVVVVVVVVAFQEPLTKCRASLRLGSVWDLRFLAFYVELLNAVASVVLEFGAPDVANGVTPGDCTAHLAHDAMTTQNRYQRSMENSGPVEIRLELSSTAT